MRRRPVRMERQFRVIAPGGIDRRPVRIEELGPGSRIRPVALETEVGLHRHRNRFDGIALTDEIPAHRGAVGLERQVE